MRRTPLTTPPLPPASERPPDALTGVPAGVRRVFAAPVLAPLNAGKSKWAMANAGGVGVFGDASAPAIGTE